MVKYWLTMCAHVTDTLCTVCHDNEVDASVDPGRSVVGVNSTREEGFSKEKRMVKRAREFLYKPIYKSAPGEGRARRMGHGGEEVWRACHPPLWQCFPSCSAPALAVPDRPLQAVPFSVVPPHLVRLDF